MSDRYDFLKSHGICVHCGQRDAFPGYVRCAECIEKTYIASAKCREDAEKRRKYNARGNQRHKELREQRKKDGLCIACGKPAKNGVLCEWCKNKRNERRRTGRSQGEVFRDRIAAGVCMRCGAEIVPGYKLCEKHLEMMRKHMKKIQYKASREWRKEIDGEWRLKKLKNSANG